MLGCSGVQTLNKPLCQKSPPPQHQRPLTARKGLNGFLAGRGQHHFPRQPFLGLPLYNLPGFNKIVTPHFPFYKHGLINCGCLGPRCLCQSFPSFLHGIYKSWFTRRLGGVLFGTRLPAWTTFHWNSVALSSARQDSCARVICPKR